MITQRQIHIDGIDQSEIHVAVAIAMLKNGQMTMQIQGCEPSFRNLVDVREMLDQTCRRIDALLPTMSQDYVKELIRG